MGPKVVLCLTKEHPNCHDFGLAAKATKDCGQHHLMVCALQPAEDTSWKTSSWVCIVKNDEKVQALHH